MPEWGLGDWKALVRRHADAAGQPLSPEVVEELAEHIADVYAAERDAGRSDRAAADSAIAILTAGAYDEIAERHRAHLGSSRLIAREADRAARPWADIGFDLRYAWRSMGRQPAFTLAVLVILAVGIGATTSAYAVIDAVLLRPLPYPAPDRLVVLSRVTPKGSSRALAAADWLDFSAANEASLGLAAYASWPENLIGGGEPERLRSVIVSGNFFDVVGRLPALGRVSTAADDTPSASGVVVLSHGFWERRFGGDPSVISGTMLLNGRPATIVGVMPDEFAIPGGDVDLWMPMALAPEVLANRASEWLSVVGRLRPGVNARAAQAALSATADSLAHRFPETNKDRRVAIHSLLEETIGGVNRPLWLGGLAA
ncbi:MAG: ABC transporter permease, partial [Vicinamibacterales bacterium]